METHSLNKLITNIQQSILKAMATLKDNGLEKTPANKELGELYKRVSTLNPIEKSLKPKDYNMFKQFATTSDEVKSFNDFYDSMSDMTDAQIMASWDKENGDLPPSIKAGYFRSIVQLRAMQEVMANKCSIEAAKKYSKRQDVDKLFNNISQYDWWVKNYKNVK